MANAGKDTNGSQVCFSHLLSAESTCRSDLYMYELGLRAGLVGLILLK